MVEALILPLVSSSSWVGSFFSLRATVPCGQPLWGHVPGQNWVWPDNTSLFIQASEGVLAQYTFQLGKKNTGLRFRASPLRSVTWGKRHVLDRIPRARWRGLEEPGLCVSFRMFSRGRAPVLHVEVPKFSSQHLQVGLGKNPGLLMTVSVDNTELEGWMVCHSIRVQCS